MSEARKYQPGDRVKIIDGKYAGKTGTFKKYGSTVFPHWCRVILDLTGRKRVQDTVFVELKQIQPHEQE